MVENDNKNLLNDNNRHGNVKAQIVPVQIKTLQHLPKRPAVDLAFHNLSYRVKEGGRNSKYKYDSFCLLDTFYYLKLPLARSKNTAFSLFPETFPTNYN